MKLLNKLLNLFDRQRHLRIGAISQPNDLMKYIQTVRAHAFQKITGKKLRLPMLEADTQESISEALSPTKRLVRKELK